MFSNSVCAHAVLDLDGVDALEFGADTSTKFIPLRSGLKIEGVNNWGEWESLRVAAAQQEYNEIQKDPSRYGTPVRCTKTPPFAFQVRGKYPNELFYTAGLAHRNRKKNADEGNELSQTDKNSEDMSGKNQNEASILSEDKSDSDKREVEKGSMDSADFKAEQNEDEH